MNNKLVLQKKRQLRIRAKVSGTHDRPRFAVHRSGSRLIVQVIDDTKGVTLVSQTAKGTNLAAAKTLGTEIAKKMVTKGIKKVVFDRGGNRYHGVIKALADSVREGGVTI